jgi:hypothetical protein
MGVLRALCQELTWQKAQQEVGRALADCEQRIAVLLRSASDVHRMLQSMAGKAPKAGLVLPEISRAPG